jgi:hypothetical protein
LLRRFDVWQVGEQKVRGNGSHPKPRRTSPDKGRLILERTIPLLLRYIRKSLKARLTVRDYAALVGLRAAQLLPVARDRFRTPDQYLEPFIPSLPPVKLLMMAWLSAIARYQALGDQGVPMMAVRYETLVASPSDSLRRIFEFCDLSCSQTSLAEAVFAEDSQGGTMYSRKSLRQSADRELSAEQLSQVHEVLREHPAIRPPDLFAPDTFTI